MPKILGNVERDKKNIEQLRNQGWHVVIVWECELKKDVRDERLSLLCREIRGPS